MSNRAIILARISDADDGETTGVDDQVRRLKAFSAENGWDVVRVIVENDTSAFKRRKIRLPSGETAMRTVRPEVSPEVLPDRKTALRPPEGRATGSSEAAQAPVGRRRPPAPF